MKQEDFQDKVLEDMGKHNAELANITGWMDKLDDKVGTLQTSGCAKGGENERRIDKIENEPKKKSVHGAVAGGGIAATFIAIAELIRAWLP